MKKFYTQIISVVMLLTLSLSVNAQTLRSASVEVSNVTTSSSTFVDVTGASVTLLNLTAGDKVMVVSSIVMNLTTTATQDATFQLLNLQDATTSTSIIRTANQYKGIATQSYVFTIASDGDKTFSLQHKVAGGVTLNTSASLSVVLLKSNGTALQADVKAVSTPVSCASTTWAEVTGTATTAITTSTSGGFVVMANIQTAKTAGATVTGEWKFQYKLGAGAWTDLGYSVQRTTSGTGKGVVNLVSSLGSGSAAGTYYFRVLHRLTSTGGGETMETQAANVIAVSFAHPSYMFQVLQGAKALATTTSNAYSDALALPATTNVGLSDPKLLMLGQFNIEANSTSNAPKFDFSVNNGAIYNGVDHERYISSNSDVGSAAMVGLATLAANTSYNLALRHASNASVPIRHISTSNILCVGVALEDNQFVVYPITVNATLGTTYASYSTLKAAFDAINVGTHKGDINISVNAPTTETASAVLWQSGKNWGGGLKSSYNFVNIYSTGNGNSITGNFAAPLIDLNGADNVTIDGRVSYTGDANLVIEQQNTSYPTIRFLNSAATNIVQYSIIKGSNSSVLSGVIDFSSSSGGVGNDDNILQNNKITCSGSNKPVYGVYSLGSSGILNTGNQILNNEFYDLFGSGAIHNVVFISSYSTEFTVSGNSFYQTAAVSAGMGGHYSFIHLENTAGNGFVVSNNYLGGSAPLCGGSALVLNSAYGTYFEAMDIHVGVAVAAEITGNTVSNINYSSAYDMPFIGIELVQGNANVTGNTVGATSGTGSITVTNTYADCVVHGIYVSTTGAVTVSDNQIGAITTVGSASYSCSLVGIGKEPDAGAVTITNNTVGNSTADNMYASSAATNAVVGQSVMGIHVEGTGVNTIHNNVVRNLTNAYDGVVSEGSVIGISAEDGTNSIVYNYVSKLTNAGSQTNNNFGAAVLGISQTSASNVVHTISNNTISELHASSASNISVIGLYFAGGTAANIINGNMISQLTNASTDINAYIYGIQAKSGTATLSNNIINVGTSENFGCNVIGIYDHALAGINNNFYFNTVYVGGSTSGTINGSSCFYRNSDASTSIIKGNIFYNARTGGTGGDHYALWLNGLISNVTIDNNDVMSDDLMVGSLNGVSYPTFVDWQTATSQEANSVNVNPSFDAAGGNLPVNYFVNQAALVLASNPTPITTDFSTITRGAVTLMGALERHDFHWQGGTSTDFNTAANWTEGAVPLAGANIIFNVNPARSCYLDQDRIVGDIEIDQNTDILVLNGHKLTITGEMGVDNSTSVIDADGANDIVEFAGFTVPQTFLLNTFANNTIDGLIINNTYGVSLPQSITVNDLTLSAGDLSIGANTLTINDAIAVTTGTLTGGASTNMIIGGAAAASTALPAVTLNNLTVNRPNGISLGGDVTVGGTLTLTEGVLTVGASRTFTFAGTTVTRTNGGIDASNATATVDFANTSSVNVPASTFSAAVNNLTVSGTGGIVSGGNFTVNGVLNLVNENPSVDRGTLDMGVNELSLGVNASSVGLGDVEGIITRTDFPLGVNLTFGNPNSYVFFISDALPLPTSMSFKLELTTPFWDNTAVLRTMDLIQVGGDASTTFRGSMHYNDGELNGNTESQLSFWSLLVDPDPDIYLDLGRTNLDEVNNAVGLGTAYLAWLSNSFGSGGFCIKNRSLNEYVWDGSESTDWSNPLNWNVNAVPDNTADVIIPDAQTTPNDPVLSPVSNALSLTLESGSILFGGTATQITIDGGTGAFVNQGGTIFPETSTFVFTNADATWSGEFTVFNLTINAAASIVPVSGSYMKIYGTVTNNGAWKSAITPNTVEYAGENQTVLLPNGAASGYYNLILSGASGTKTMPASALDIYGSLDITGNITVNFAQAFDVDGNLTTGFGTTVSTGAFASTIGGAFTVGDYFNISWGGTLTMDGAAQTTRIQTTGKLDVGGTFVNSAAGYITFVSKDSGTGQLDNSGTVTNTTGYVRLEKEMKQATGWYYISMPFNVPAASVTDASTGDPVSIGDASDSYMDLYLMKYDGAARDAEGLPNVSGAGVYWANVVPKQFDQYKGYIFATERDKTFNLTSSAGEVALFNNSQATVNVPVGRYETNMYTQHHSWNLLGNPFSSGYDMQNAGTVAPFYYYYNGTNYDVIDEADPYTIYPFTAFFCQALNAGTTLDFAVAGMTFRSTSVAAALEYDEIDLNLEQDSLVDRLRIRLRSDASANFDPTFDAFKFRSMNLAYPQIYAKSNNYNYAVHSLAPSTSTQTIPLTYIAGKVDSFTVVLNGVDKLKNYSKVILKDAITGKEQDLMTDASYTFSSGKGTFSSRLSIMLEAPIQTNVSPVEQSEIKALVVNGTIAFEGMNSLASVSVYDITGKLVAQYENVPNNYSLPVKLNGVYLLKVSTESQMQQFKLLVTQN